MADAFEQTSDDLMVKAAWDVSEELDADIILFNQPIYDLQAYEFHRRLEAIPPEHENVFLILVTFGGSPHAAYTIARELQLRYKNITICIGGDCYSAGTLLAISANTLVIADRGRLGPLDVQRVKKDEYRERLSGLTLKIALDELRDQAVKSLKAIALDLKEDLAFGSLSFKTALDVSGSMVANMFAEIYKQIDPVKLADDARALQVAAHYGKILGKRSSNLKDNTIDRLLTNYPSHECIIDRLEATELFKDVRSPGKEETALLNILGYSAVDAVGWDDRILIIFPPRTNTKDSTARGEVKTDERISEQIENQEPGGKGESRTPEGTTGGNGSSGKSRAGKS